MPEGDTIHKLAAFMAPRLEGRELVSVDFRDRPDDPHFRGRRVQQVEARGKHLLIRLDNNRIIRSHLGMHGSWHVYATTAPVSDWRRPRKQASLVLATEESRFVCFNARDVEVLASPSVRERIVRTRLGPDLIADDVPPGTLARRALAFADADTLIVDTLLDQRVAAGIGNVYKSEVLFLERLPVDLRTAETASDRIESCYRRAAELLRQNLGGGPRVTRRAGDSRGRLWVYGRTGQKCHDCDSLIETRRLGRHHRSTWWCPACQQDSHTASGAKPTC